MSKVCRGWTCKPYFLNVELWVCWLKWKPLCLWFVCCFLHRLFGRRTKSLSWYQNCASGREPRGVIFPMVGRAWFVSRTIPICCVWFERFPLDQDNRQAPVGRVGPQVIHDTAIVVRGTDSRIPPVLFRVATRQAQAERHRYDDISHECFHILSLYSYFCYCLFSQ